MCGTVTRFEPPARGPLRRYGVPARRCSEGLELVTALDATTDRGDVVGDRVALFTALRRGFHRLQARVSPVNFTEYPRVLVPANI